ncbi:coxsackievirus and adenovirus receptor isoform X2 [Bombina bombina]|uniref:coxsackievirus and adenovirus receptor isoform X2 n=1 Tax=Bombina bombina TaxID=8345 RepID=UPI00235A4F64|nr:coxsackievirus and adenovirus receptor isoform X2 [Bombina bombina]
MALGSVALHLFLFVLYFDSTRALTIDQLGPTTYEKAQGDKVTLECKYELGPDDTATLDIEWTLVAPDSKKEDTLIILLNGDRVYEKYEELKNRVHFISSDPNSLDASIEIINLKSTDTGTYQCKVKKLPGTGIRKFTLSVFEKPAKTRCYVEGAQEIGKDLSLKCNSKEGTYPITYSWQKVTGQNKLPPLSTLDTNSGVLTVKNASQEYSGLYKCIASNRVGSEECLVTLSVVSPSNVAGKIAGAVIGTLLGLILLGLLIFCCCKKQKEKKYEKEVEHEIKEDVAPPKSRASTARSYIGSNHSSLGSMSPSNMEGYSKARYNQVPSEEYERPPLQTPNFVSSKYHGLTVV